MKLRAEFGPTFCREPERVCLSAGRRGRLSGKTRTDKRKGVNRTDRLSRDIRPELFVLCEPRSSYDYIRDHCVPINISECNAVSRGIQRTYTSTFFEYCFPILRQNESISRDLEVSGKKTFIAQVLSIITINPRREEKRSRVRRKRESLRSITISSRNRYHRRKRRYRRLCRAARLIGSTSAASVESSARNAPTGDE